MTCAFFFQLTDMNAQWGQYNAEKETIVKELEERVKAQQVEIEHLERLSGSGDASSQSLTFSPAQQVFICQNCTGLQKHLSEFFFVLAMGTLVGMRFLDRYQSINHLLCVVIESACIALAVIKSTYSVELKTTKIIMTTVQQFHLFMKVRLVC